MQVAFLTPAMEFADAEKLLARLFQLVGGNLTPSLLSQKRPKYLSVCTLK